MPAQASVGADGAIDAAARHVGKYRSLWQWLAAQTADELSLTFGEIEEVIGMPLPTSCRRHPAHWHSYEGSAVARAIQDAGWRASNVSLNHQHLTLRRATRPESH